MTVLSHYVVVKETRNWNIMLMNNATLLIFKRNDKNERLVYIFEYFAEIL